MFTSHAATILIVDDSPENLVLMSTLLKEHYKVKVANSGARGLELARSANPACLLCCLPR